MAVEVLYEVAARVINIPIPETGGEGKEVRAVDSTSSIIWSASTTELGNPQLYHGPGG